MNKISILFYAAISSNIIAMYIFSLGCIQGAKEGSYVPAAIFGLLTLGQVLVLICLGRGY